MNKGYTIISVFATLSLLGLFLIPFIPLQLINDHYEKSLLVSFSWPHAMPSSLELQVTTPLEGIIRTVQGVDHVSSSSDYNRGSITIELDSRADLDRARFEIASLIRHVYRQLPPGVSYPEITIGNSNGHNIKPLLSLQLSGHKSSAELRRYAETSLRPMLLALAGVSSVEIFGGRDQEWQIEYDRKLANSLKINDTDLTKMLGLNEQRTHLGWINSPNGSKTSLSLAPVSDTANFGDLPISLISKKRILRLSDIAVSQKSEQPPMSYFRINGKQAIQMIILSSPHADQISTGRAIREVLAKIQAESQPTYNVDLDYDAAEELTGRLSQIKWQLALTLTLLTLLNIVCFRSMQGVCILLSGVLANTFITFLILYIFQIPVDLSSISTIVFSIGLMGGNLFFVYRNYHRYRINIGILSLLGSSIMAAATLSVIWILPVESRENLTEFATITLITQLLSFFTCMWLVPAILAQFSLRTYPRPPAPDAIIFQLNKSYFRALNVVVRYRKSVLLVGLLLFGLPFFLIPPEIKADSNLARTYNHFIGEKWQNNDMRELSNKWLGGVLRLFTTYVRQRAARPSSEQTTLHINAGLPNHSTTEQMNQLIARFETELLKFTEIRRFVSQVRSGQFGSITVYFREPYSTGSFPHLLKERAILLSSEMSGVDWNIVGVGQGFNVNVNDAGSASFTVLLKGYSYSQLTSIAQNLEARFLLHPRIQNIDINNVPGVTFLKDLQAFRIRPDPFLMATYGLSQNQLTEEVRRYNTRPEADLFTFHNDVRIGIRVRPKSNNTLDVYQLYNEPVGISDSSYVKFVSQNSLVRERIAPTIRKVDQNYVRLITFDYLGSVAFGREFLDRSLDSLRAELPIGFTAERKTSGLWESEGSKHYLLIGVSLILTFIIAAVMFESLRQPFALFGAIMMSYAGLMAAFYRLDLPFDYGGYASLLLLAGLISFPTILLINVYNNISRTEGLPPLKAYCLAVTQQLQSILLYAACIVISQVSMLVIAPNQVFWTSLAVGICGGIISYLPVIVFFVPTILLPSKNQKVTSL
ncbi:efflux RND transporter permease subunit [Dyadobacter sp. SG02]|uniref:efflux RND transporter permease subunit n=1 Tax=Dyadobacter sp. SG02 TaxID=1855291 RepID=UPI000B85C646|nr:efflux RND transporter permease subunit [Dyadobacter sp. SG02]